MTVTFLFYFFDGCELDIAMFTNESIDYLSKKCFKLTSIANLEIGKLLPTKYVSCSPLREMEIKNSMEQKNNLSFMMHKRMKTNGRPKMIRSFSFQLLSYALMST